MLYIRDTERSKEIASADILMYDKYLLKCLQFQYILLKTLVVCDLCLHRTNIEKRKTSEQQFIFEIGILCSFPWDQPEVPVEIINLFISHYLFIRTISFHNLRLRNSIHTGGSNPKPSILLNSKKR